MKIGKHDLNICKYYSQSCCYQDPDVSSFNYNHVESALLDRIGWDCFIAKRICVIQMK